MSWSMTALWGLAWFGAYMAFTTSLSLDKANKRIDELEQRL